MNQWPIGADTESEIGRNEYHDGQVLSAQALRRESNYFLARERQHSALAHTPGVLVGLKVEIDPETGFAYVEKGAAIDAQGRLVVVPGRHRIDASLVGPSDRPSGSLVVELLYGHAEPDDATTNGCASPDVGVTRETFEIRLTNPDDAGDDLVGYTVSASPSDDPAHLAPVPLGMVKWDSGARMFTGVNELRRQRAGIRANTVEDPDEAARFTLATPDQGALLEIGTADGGYQQQLAIPRYGTVWVRRASMGPDGAELRKTDDAPDNSKPTFAIQLEDTDPGAKFGRKPLESDSDTGDETSQDDPELAHDEYFPGTLELRVLFERDGTGAGRRRVVIGHVGTEGDTFRPSIVVYDRPSTTEASESNASTVEVWGDLVVRGTAWLKGASRLTENFEKEQDQLDLILRQIAGPLGETLRAWLKGDPNWIKDIAKAVAGKLSSDEYEAIADKVFVLKKFTEEVERLIDISTADAGWLESTAGQLVTLAPFITAVDDQINTRTDGASWINTLTGRPEFETAIRDKINTQTATEVWLETTAANIAKDPTAMGSIAGGLASAANLDAAVTQLKDSMDTSLGEAVCEVIATAISAGGESGRRAIVDALEPPSSG